MTRRPCCTCRPAAADHAAPALLPPALHCVLQHIDGINLFGLISLVSLLFCVPAAVAVEGHLWGAAWHAASSKLGLAALLQLLALSGLFYHLYNQARGGRQRASGVHAAAAAAAMCTICERRRCELVQPAQPVACCRCSLLLQASYMVLDQGVSPVTFSVGNTMKRVAVVVSSVMFFRNPVSVLNWVGSGVAILGTYLYSLATDKAKAEAAAKAKAR